MSIQAVAWAISQDLPGTAKLVLIALCNRADEVSGHCWPSTERVAKDASCSLRSVHRWIGALSRNGYVDVRRCRGKDGKQRANNYWIRFDRMPQKWEYYSQEPEAEPEEDTQHIDEANEPGANLASGDEAGSSPENEQPPDQLAPGPSAIVGTRQESSDSSESSALEPSRARPMLASHDRVHDPPRSLEDELQDLDIPIQKALAMIPAPIDFDANSRQSEIEMLQAAEAERAKNQRQFVFKGTKAWQAWCQYRKKKYGIESCPETWHTVKGKQRQGWWFQTLFPPPEAV